MYALSRPKQQEVGGKTAPPTRPLRKRRQVTTEARAQRRIPNNNGVVYKGALIKKVKHNKLPRERGLKGAHNESLVRRHSDEDRYSSGMQDPGAKAGPVRRTSSL